MPSKTPSKFKLMWRHEIIHYGELIFSDPKLPLDSQTDFLFGNLLLQGRDGSAHLGTPSRQPDEMCVLYVWFWPLWRINLWTNSKENTIWDGTTASWKFHSTDDTYRSSVEIVSGLWKYNTIGNKELFVNFSLLRHLTQRSSGERSSAKGYIYCAGYMERTQLKKNKKWGLSRA